jgi:alpha-amylase
MPNLCLYFQIHQPVRLRPYSVFDIGHDSKYFNDEENARIVRKVAEKCYIPTNKILLQLIREYNGAFKVAFSISGVAIEQFAKHAPEVLAGFRALAMTGCVEFLAETYHHSLVGLYDQKEFEYQVLKHIDLIQDTFDYHPTTFRNSELVYSDGIARMAQKLGFSAIVAEGAERTLDWRSPNYVYQAADTGLKLLLRNYKFSDDIAYRFSNRAWEEYPLTAEKFSRWISAVKDDVVNIFMDYETYGEHHWTESGIFNFLYELPAEMLKHSIGFRLPREVAAQYTTRDPLFVEQPTSWADTEKDLSAWLGNEIQRDAATKLYALGAQLATIHDKKLHDEWRKLTTTDHLYYLSTKHLHDGSIHAYFSPYQSPYDAYINLMNVLDDLEQRIKKAMHQTKHRVKTQKPLAPVTVKKRKKTVKKKSPIIVAGSQKRRERALAY